MSDKLKPREILICPVKLSFYYVNRNSVERNNKVACVSREDFGSVLVYFFSMSLGIAGDFDLH